MQFYGIILFYLISYLYSSYVVKL